MIHLKDFDQGQQYNENYHQQLDKQGKDKQFKISFRLKLSAAKSEILQSLPLKGNNWDNC